MHKNVKEILMSERFRYIAPDRSDALTHLAFWVYDRGDSQTGRIVPLCGRDKGSDSWRIRFADSPDLARLCSDCSKELDRATAAAKHLARRKAKR